MLDPVLHFDENGKLIKSFGCRPVIAPHGIFVDREDNVWITDCTCTGGGGLRGAGRGNAGATPAAEQERTSGLQVQP